MKNKDLSIFFILKDYFGESYSNDLLLRTAQKIVQYAQYQDQDLIYYYLLDEMKDQEYPILTDILSCNGNNWEAFWNELKSGLFTENSNRWDEEVFNPNKEPEIIKIDNGYLSYIED